ncbi:MAG: hypothetical protein J7M25_06840 [Deltaproteobacteria bacterium]|nr:hypothetical protein [Deltaproteobacteria bacterium]
MSTKHKQSGPNGRPRTSAAHAQKQRTENGTSAAKEPTVVERHRDHEQSSEDLALSELATRFQDHIHKVCMEGRPTDIFEFEELDEAFPALPVQDAFYAIQELGLADATELVAAASPEQIQAFLDLDVWTKDQVTAIRVLDWFDVLMQLDDWPLIRDLMGMDPELIVVAIVRSCRIVDLTAEVLPDEDFPAGPWNTPDTFYAIIPKDAESVAEYNRICRFLDRLYRSDLEFAHRFVKAARWEIVTEMEELAYRWRSGRLQDLGFSDYYEALEVYTYLKPTQVTIGEGTADAPPEPGLPSSQEALVRAEIEEEDFLARCLAEVQAPEEMSRISHAAAALANKMMAADLVDGPDFHQATAYMNRMRRYLSLGLEHLTGRTPEKGPMVLASVSVLRIFRVGFSLTLDLKRLILQLTRVGRISLAPSGATLLDPPWDELSVALTRRRPAMVRAFDNPPGDGTRAIKTLADVAHVVSLIGDIADQWPLCFTTLEFPLEILMPGGLEGCIPAEPGAVTLGDLFRTALLDSLLGQPLSPTPLSDQDLALAKKELAALRRRRPVLRYALEVTRKAIDENHGEEPKHLERILGTWCAPLQARNLERLAGTVVTRPNRLNH